MLTKSLDFKLEELVARISASKTIAVDVETSGLDWKHNHIVGYVFTFSPKPSDSYYLPVRHKGDKNIHGTIGLDTATGWDGKRNKYDAAIINALNEPGKMLFFHNGAFDLKFLCRVGYKLDANYEDTILNAPLIDEWQGSFSLESCCRIAGVQAKKGDEIRDYIRRLFPEATAKDYMGHFWRLSGDDKMAHEYAKGDGTSTWQLREWQMQQIREQDLEEVHAVESRLLPVLVGMTVFGIKVDVPRLDELLHSTAHEVECLMADFPSGFNVKSSEDVRKWCEKHGNTDWPLTPAKQKPSFPEEWLLKHEAGQKIVAVRKLETLRNTFLLPLRDRHLWKGRVHTSFNQLRGDEYGTVTGRLSSSDPNMQAASKRNKEIGGRHRSVFAADDGKRWMSTDYKQCEPVLLAWYSRSEVLLSGFKANPPVDPHQAVANATGLSRDLGKRINQTLITGGGKGVLVAKYGVDPKRVDAIMADYFRAMPEIKKLQKRAGHVMKTRGYVISLLGRRARLNDPNKDYQAMNRLLQGGNADVIKLKMVQIDDYLRSEGYPVRMLNNVHDSIDFQFDPDNRKHLDECMRIMTDFSPGQPISLDVPLMIDAGEGSNWSEATYG